MKASLVESETPCILYENSEKREQMVVCERD